MVYIWCWKWYHCCGQDWNFSLKLSGHHKYAKKTTAGLCESLWNQKLFASSLLNCLLKNSASYLWIWFQTWVAAAKSNGLFEDRAANIATRVTDLWSYSLIRLILSINILSGELTSFLPFFKQCWHVFKQQGRILSWNGQDPVKNTLIHMLGLCKDLFLGARRISCNKYRVFFFYSYHLLYFSEAS